MYDTIILTVDQAMSKGYTHFMESEGETLVKIKDLSNYDIEYYKGKMCHIVDMSAPTHFSITEDAIRDLIKDHVYEQDEVADENDNLYNIANEHDYSKLVDELNEKFSAHKYYRPLDNVFITFN